ncbi:putative 43kDa postsynaptic protein [Lupinus albus]|uniref:Putative 43kDa postsynaptic protein n=1 Tax=Lupinus albus TaxID=3870 RepID=A0A6A4NSG7_LUPAL|nr:putative 43kDa postsynaptic protein [Lupinus albus]
MSHLGNPISDEFGEFNKPDFRELDLGSPVSPLRNRGPAISSSSSSSGSFSGGRTVQNPLPKRSESAPTIINTNHAGELSGSTENSPTNPRGGTGSNPGHARSSSGSASPLIYSGQSVNSPVLNVLPTGNICPSRRIVKTGMASNRSTRSDVLGTGTGNYGHGSIMRGGKEVSGSGNVNEMVKRGVQSLDPEELKRVGNEHYKRGHFLEALSLYDKAIALSPGSAAYRSNRAAALTGLGRLVEAVRECEEAVSLNPNYGRALYRLATLFIRLGQVENARKHLSHPGVQSDPSEMRKLQMVEKHITKCADGRRIGDWKSVLREVDAAIASGADSSPQLFMCRAEALLKLHQIDDAESTLSYSPKSEWHTNSTSQARFFGMLSEAYSYFIRAQIEMVLGRFENAVAAAEKACQIDSRNVEVAVLLNNVRMVTRARMRGNDLFKSERFTEACSAYGEGLKLDPSNSVLYCNRAACWFKLGQWERSIEDCNQALLIQPNYTKALLRRAASNSKLERWEEAVKDHEVLRKDHPNDDDVAEALFHAQIALKKSLSSLEQFRAAISLPGVSIVHFEIASNSQCKQISPFVDTLCGRYPSINFLKVDIQRSPTIATAENAKVVPTFKIYKNGNRVKEILCPSRDMLEHSVRHYSL